MSRSMKMIIRCITFVMSFGFILSTVVAQEEVEADGSILLPAQKQNYIAIDYATQQRLSLSGRWQSFVQMHGHWSVQWNEATQTPHRAFGKAIKIDGFPVITEENVEAAARTFLSENAAMLGINPEELRLVRAKKVNRRWYVTLVQMREGIEVLFSEVELRIFENGNVMAFGVDYYSDIDISLSPSISFAAAKKLSRKHLIFDASTDRIFGEERLYILPRREGQSIDYHLVYKVKVMTMDPIGNFVVFVDAHSGEIIWRLNKVRNAEVHVQVSGEIQEIEPTDPFVVKSFRDQNVMIGNETLITNNLGEVMTDITTPQMLTASLEGPFVNVNRQDGPDASITMTVNPGDTVSILWDDSNSHPAERDAFYHTNLIHNFITTLDPNFTTINYEMPCAVNIADVCNAFWDGNGINFFSAGGGCPNTGQMASVVYHEYGHGINDRFYEENGSPDGVINGAVHEGMADVVAALIEDWPGVGRGFFGVPGQPLRNLDNTNSYPDDISGEVHHDGLIIGGAFWDLRLNTDLVTAQYLHHYAMYGTPDDFNTGIAYGEWFLETVIVDDDDGDLSNGTPNFTEIADAFNAHGIGTALFMSFSFSHTPVEDTQDTLNAYPVNFHLEGIGVGGTEPDSVFLHYSLDNFQTIGDVPATLISPGEYRADIPAQSIGSIVRYNFTAYDPIANIHITIPSSLPFGNAYVFLVGFQSELLDELEVASGWQVGAPSDDATTGIWELADPEQYDCTYFGLSFFVAQPDTDHTVSGQLCFVTGATATVFPSLLHIPNGKTTLFSPVFDLSTLSNPVIQYYRWFATISAMGSSGNGEWKVDISNDNGPVWVNVINTREGTNDWERIRFRVADYVPPTDSVQLRFIAYNLFPNAPSLVEALVDDFQIFAVDSNLTAIDSTIATLNIPWKFELSQNYPNPFNPSTNIKYSIPENGYTKLTVYNLVGEEVKVLVNGQVNAGFYEASFNAANLPSGIYFYKLQTGTSVETKKMVLLR